MDFIQSKVEEILYQYVGISKPIKKEKNLEEALEVETNLLPTDLEQVSPDSDKKSTASDVANVEEMKDEEVEEEIVEDDDFESPAFEPIEPMEVDKNEQNSNLSAISGLTSQDSVENKNEEAAAEVQEQQQHETQLSQISSTQDMSQEAETVPAATDEVQPGNGSVQTASDSVIKEEPMVIDTTTMDQQETLPEEPEKSQFDLNKDSIEFTGTERKSMPLDDSTNSCDNKADEKILQPQDVPRNMELENLYENDTTDSSEMRMEIDLKDETTQETADSSKIEESSRDSTVSKEKHRSEHKKDSHHHHKSDRSRDKHKSSSSSRKSSHHHRSSSSKSQHDDKSKSRSDGKSRSSTSHKRSSSEKNRSSSSRRDHDRDKKSSKDDASRSKHREHKKTDDHHQEKSSSRRRRSTDHDSNEGKGGQGKSGGTEVSSVPEPSKNKSAEKSPENVESPLKNQETSVHKSTILEKILVANSEAEPTTSGTKKEQKSSILVKYDYLKSPPKTMEVKRVDKVEDEFPGFKMEDQEVFINPWIECLRKEKVGNSNKKHSEQKKFERTTSLEAGKSKLKPKGKTVETSGDSPANLANGSEVMTPEARAQSIAQQQRYSSDDLYKPRVDFGANRNRRRRCNSEMNSGERDTPDMKVNEVSNDVKTETENN